MAAVTFSNKAESLY
jgi:hypothetical protein